MTSISTQPVKGMRDILGKEARLKRKVESVISERAARYGFEPMQLPVLENLNVLTIKGGGGEEAVKELFTLEDQSKRKLGMRFEHTTSLARVLAGNPELPKPIKALNMGTVYRYDNPQALRYREFTQADCDIIGVKSETAEAECVLLGIEIMQSINMEGFYFRINDRRITNELLLLTEIPSEQAKDAMRILDKLDKIGMEGVKKELEDKGLPTTILTYLNQTLPQIKKALENAKLDLKGVQTLEGLFETLKKQKKDSFVKFDPSLVRGLEYYTGPVWEIYGGVSASVGSGGRYDNLIRSLGGPDLPAVGISFGVDRLVSVLLDKWNESPIDVFVIPIGKVFDQAQLLTSQLREDRLRVEIDLMERGVGKNLNYANAKGIPVVVFAGEDELKEKKVKIRDMGSGQETMVSLSPLSGLITQIRSILDNESGKKS